MSKLLVYQIWIKEQLDTRWAVWFHPLVIRHERSGATTLTGSVRDQAELMGLLIKVHNLNLTLVAVNGWTPRRNPIKGRSSDITSGENSEPT